MKAYISQWVRIDCPSCGDVLLRSGGVDPTLFCGNSYCKQHLKEYRVPSYELELVAQAEWTKPA